MDVVEFNQAKQILGESRLSALKTLYDNLHGNPPAADKSKFRANHVGDWESLDSLEHSLQIIRTRQSDGKYEVRIFALPFIDSFRAQWLLEQIGYVYIFLTNKYNEALNTQVNINVIKEEFDYSDVEIREIMYYMKDLHDTFVSISPGFPFADVNTFSINEKVLKGREALDIILDYVRWHLLPRKQDVIQNMNGFLIGAGFSAGLGMPLAAELSESFYTFLTDTKLALIKDGVKRWKPYGDDMPLDADTVDDGIALLEEYKRSKGGYEQFLADLEDRASALGVSREKQWTYQYLISIFNDMVYRILYIYQNSESPKIYNEGIKYFGNITKLLSDNGTWVFSLNHDMILEYMAMEFDIPITYGDSGEISFPVSNTKMDEQLLFTTTQRKKYFLDDMSFFKGTRGINLVKLHGGLNEMTYQDGSLVCNLKVSRSNVRHLAKQLQTFHDEMAFYANGQKVSSGKDKIITNNNGELDVVTHTVLMGGNKFSKTLNFKTGEEKLKLFSDVLEQITELWIIGYSFADEHINNRLVRAMHKNEHLRLHIIDPEITAFPKFLQQFDYDNRLKRAKCTAAEWFDYYKTEKWDMDSSRIMKEFFQKRLKIYEALNKNIHAAPIQNLPRI